MFGGGVGVLVVLLDVFFYVLLISLYCGSDVFVGVCVTAGSNIDIVAIHVGYVLLPPPRIIVLLFPAWL
jgi:hypothetical protein